MENEAGSSFSGLKTMQLNDQKAGMEGLNKEAINKIIYENSKGTPYFTFQEKRQKSIDVKVRDLQAEMEKITESDRKKSLKKMDLLGETLEIERNLRNSIVHIDMDAFYAAVEMRDNPDLKDKPIAVGSSSMLSTSNYHARKYGVRAAMPGFIGKKLCPDLIIVPYNFDKYCAVSKEMRKIVAEYDPHYSASSLDEVYLDLTEYIRNKHVEKVHNEDCLNNDSFAADENVSYASLLNPENNVGYSAQLSDELRDKMAYDIVEEIRQRIYETTQLTVSAGIAPNTMLAKVCSDQNKPNGQYQINSTVEAVKSFISTLPVKKVSGIGPVQGQILNSIGIVTCADMWCKRDLVDILFSPTAAEFYMHVALGIASTTVKSEYVRKSIGNERTFKEIHKPEELHRKCEELCNDLIEDLKPKNMLGKVIVLKIKTTDFKTYTRNHSLKYYTADPEIIKKAARKLLDTEIAAASLQPLKLRLMGVRMCNLVPKDSVSGGVKQQITLEKCLMPKMVTVTNQTEESSTCPVCLRDFFTSFSVFNEHVNNCVNNPIFGNEEIEPNGQDLINDKGVGLEDSYPAEGACSYDLINTTDEQRVLPHAPEDSNSDHDEFLCPICHLSQKVSNLTEINNHIDSCLNKGTIKEILASDLPLFSKRKKVPTQKINSKRKKGSRKEKRIDEYFQ